jgi:hypothetical protein
MDNNYIVVTCPHCQEYVFVYLKEFNCKIFRHGTFKTTLKQIEPHLSKEKCDLLKSKDLIYGCGKPFKLVEKEGKILAEICDYI